MVFDVIFTAICKRKSGLLIAVVSYSECPCSQMQVVASHYNRNSVVILYSDDGFILSLVKSLRSLHMAAGAVVMYEGEIADEM